MANKILLEPDKYYHVFNHAIGNEALFMDKKDYLDFIDRYAKYVGPISDTLAYCLMPNHFHICLKIKGVHEILKMSEVKNLQCVEAFIYHRLGHFLNGFVQAYNKKNQRLGGLFVGNFKRKYVLSDDDLRRLICYIHNNPVEAGIVKSVDDWPYSSYPYISKSVSDSKIPIWMEELLRIFDDLENFRFMHKHIILTENYL